MTRTLAPVFLLTGLTAIAVSPPALSDAQNQAVTKVVIERYQFDPPEITVKAGTKVEFVNNDQIPHSLVVEAPNGETFRSKEQLDEGETFSVALAAPGIAAYFCDLHPGMKGRITVTK